MTSKKRFLAALAREIPDRLPVTTHHVMPYFLKAYMNGVSYLDFFDHFGLDPIYWIVAHKPDPARREYFDPEQVELDFLEAPRICSENWQIRSKKLQDQEYEAVQYDFITPDKTLSMVLKSNEYTTWVTERLIKEKSDIDIFARYATLPICDVEGVNRDAVSFGERGMIRGSIPGFDVYGQPGCWQDAAVLYGIEKLILETFDDPEWVHSFLNVLLERKKHFIQSVEGANYDLGTFQKR